MSDIAKLFDANGVRIGRIDKYEEVRRTMKGEADDTIGNIRDFTNSKSYQGVPGKYVHRRGGSKVGGATDDGNIFDKDGKTVGRVDVQGGSGIVYNASGVKVGEVRSAQRDTALCGATLVLLADKWQFGKEWNSGENTPETP
jgi:hypothetical protein